MQPIFPFVDRDPDCTCGPDCEDICIGWCGCKACFHPDADPNVETEHDRRWLALCAAADGITTEIRCDHCGRLSIYGHMPDCRLLGGKLDRLADEKQRVKQRIRELRQQIKRLEGTL